MGFNDHHSGIILPSRVFNKYLTGKFKVPQLYATDFIYLFIIIILDRYIRDYDSIGNGISMIIIAGIILLPTVFLSIF